MTGESSESVWGEGRETVWVRAGAGGGWTQFLHGRRHMTIGSGGRRKQRFHFTCIGNTQNRKKNTSRRECHRQARREREGGDRGVQKRATSGRVTRWSMLPPSFLSTWQWSWTGLCYNVVAHPSPQLLASAIHVNSWYHFFLIRVWFHRFDLDIPVGSLSCLRTRRVFSFCLYTREGGKLSACTTRGRLTRDEGLSKTLFEGDESRVSVANVMGAGGSTLGA